MKEGKTEDICWSKLNVLADEVLTLAAHVNDQTKRTLEVLSETDSVHTQEFTQAFDSYGKGLSAAIKGAGLLQEGAYHLQSAYDILRSLEKEEATKNE